MKAKKILIVEDDFFSRGAMEKILESHNYQTSSCATAEEAVIKLQEESFGILITDLRMQEMDGLELIKEARRIYPEIPHLGDWSCNRENQTQSKERKGEWVLS